MKTINELTDAQSYLVTSASYIYFVVMVFLASYVINETGYEKGMSLGLMTMALSALLFILAPNARTYWMFLTVFFYQSIGMILLQTASNPYITILDPIRKCCKKNCEYGYCNQSCRCFEVFFIFTTILL